MPEQVAKREIDVGPFKAAALRKHENGETWSTMCRRIEWQTSVHGPDTNRLQRTLGIKPCYNSLSRTQERSGNEKTYYAKSMSYEQALLMCRALDVDPIDLGL